MKHFSIILFAIVLLVASCREKVEETETTTPEVKEGLQHPEWSRNTTIYEVNIRQYTPEGTIAAFIPHMERLKEMGIDILWLMPIQPIGELNRKGTMGSYYSVKDYTAVNPEFGGDEDFRALVEKAHELDMKVILDWVANHSAWDNPWMANEGWYTTDSLGNVIAPNPDWSDVADLNYDNAEMRAAMIDAMQYWVEEFEIDGYRCDVASMVPTDFWNNVRLSLDSIKPVFMLAEAEEPLHHDSAFDMSYGWELMHIMNEMAKGHKNVNHITRYMEKEQNRFPEDSYRMYFTTNHDENSWNGTVFERYGENYQANAVMAATIWGMPLIYSGQEVGLDYALEFFEKSEIDWSNLEYEAFFKTLLELNQQNQALWNGSAGGSFRVIQADSVENVYIYSREKDENAVVVALNFSDQPYEIQANTGLSGDFVEVFSGLEMKDPQSLSMTIEPHGYKLLAK